MLFSYSAAQNLVLISRSIATKIIHEAQCQTGHVIHGSILADQKTVVLNTEFSHNRTDSLAQWWTAPDGTPTLNQWQEHNNIADNQPYLMVAMNTKGVMQIRAFHLNTDQKPTEITVELSDLTH